METTYEFVKMEEYLMKVPYKNLPGYPLRVEIEDSIIMELVDKDGTNDTVPVHMKGNALTGVMEENQRLILFNLEIHGKIHGDCIPLTTTDKRVFYVPLSSRSGKFKWFVGNR